MPVIYTNPPVHNLKCFPDLYYSCPSCDPYWDNVTLLLRGDGASGASVFTDSSTFARTPTVVGTITTISDPSSFAGSAIQFTTAVGYLEYTGTFVSSSEDFTFEAWVQIQTQNNIAGGYVYPRGIFLEAQNAGALVFADAGMIGSATAMTILAPTASAYTYTDYGLPTGYTRHHVAFVRQSGTLTVYINGMPVAFFVSNTAAIDKLIIGNRNNVTYATGAVVEEVRFTRGVARYTGPFSLQSAAHPTCSEPSNSPPTISFSTTGLTTSTPTNTTWKFSSTAAQGSTFADGILYARGIGKRYIEFVIQGNGDSVTNTGRGCIVGFTYEGATGNPSSITNGFMVSNIDYNGSSPGYILNNSGFVVDANYDFVKNDVIGMAIDHITGNIWVRKNGLAWIGGGDPTTGTLPTATVANGWNMRPKCFVYHRGVGYTGDWQVQTIVEGSAPNAAIPTGYALYQSLWVHKQTTLSIHAEIAPEWLGSLVGAVSPYGSNIPVFWPNVIGAMAPPVNGHTLVHMGQWDSNYTQPLPVKVYDVDVVAGTYVEVATFNFVTPVSPTVGEATTDVSMMITGSGTTVYTREGLDGLQRTYITPEALGTSQIRCARSGSNIILGSTLFGSKRLYRFDVSSGTLLATSAPLPHFVGSLLIIGSYVYAVSSTINFVYKLDLATLTLQSYTKLPYASTSGNASRLLAVDGKLVYISSFTSNIYMLLNNTWLNIGSIGSGTYITYDTHGSSVFQVGNSIIYGTHKFGATPTVFQLYQSSLTSAYVSSSDSSCTYYKKILRSYGNTPVSTDYHKYGKSAMYIPNTGASLATGWYIDQHQDLMFGNKDFTIEMWAYRLTNAYAGTLFFLTLTGTFSFTVDVNGLIVLNYYTSGGAQSNLATSVAFPLGTWNHVAVQRVGAYFECYLNGARIHRVAITGSTGSVNMTGPLYLGRTNAPSALQWNGYIDEVRVTKGVSRITASNTTGKLITLVGVSEPATASTTVSIPPHQAGDMVIVFAQGSSVTIPTPPAGWSSIYTMAPTNGAAYVVAYIIDITNTLTSATFTSGSAMTCVVYRGTQDIGAVALTPANSGSVTSINIPALTPMITDGTSVILGITTINQVTTTSTPTGMTFRADNASPAVGTQTSTVWDTGNGVGTFAGSAATFGTAGYATAATIELRAARIFKLPSSANCNK